MERGPPSAGGERRVRCVTRGGRYTELLILQNGRDRFYTGKTNRRRHFTATNWPIYSFAFFPAGACVPCGTSLSAFRTFPAVSLAGAAAGFHGASDGAGTAAGCVEWTATAGALEAGIAGNT